MRKPAMTWHGMPPKPVVYFAGKISVKDWREEVLLHYRPGGEHERHRLWDPRHRLEYGTFFYGGPFFVSCDHGCGHALNTHGNQPCERDVERNALQQKVFDVNCARLALADAVFVYVNEVSCFGTMVEVGMAAASAKAIFLAFGPDLSQKQRADLWMLQASALKTYQGSAGFTWRSLHRDLGLSGAAVPLLRAHRG